MPRYFFQVHDGSEILDREGVELPDRDAALSMAVKTSGGMIQELAATMRPDVEWVMEVVDLAGKVVVRITVLPAKFD